MNHINDLCQPDFWDEHYQNGRVPWDLGQPTPPFQRLAETNRFPPGQMIVLGAGRGHDARLFARHGFVVTAVDFATEAITAMQQLDDPVHPVEIVQANFFWLPPAFSRRYDYALDYTSFCAILPERRGDYADVVARILKPNGLYITLAFPIGTRPDGPPFTVQPDAIIELFAERGFVLEQRERPFDSVPERKPHEELLILRLRL